MIALSLGLKFNFKLSPDFSNMKRSVEEGMHKIAWKTFFLNKNEDVINDDMTNLIIKVRKSIQVPKKQCPIQNVLFNKTFISNCFTAFTSSIGNKNAVHTYLVSQLKQFTSENNLVIRPSDKNAGIVIMDSDKYNHEILRQLNDESVYIPTTRSKYSQEMYRFYDSARHISNVIFKTVKLKSIIPAEHSPAHFYILPKIHKPFQDFPVGRPICSTLKTINRGFAILLDNFLRPFTLCIPDLIIDTPHLLFLLNNLNLDKGRKYLLVAADIHAMYQELPLNVCKTSCINFYDRHKGNIQLPFQLTSEQLKVLLNLSLDYSFIEFEDQLFFQKKGIQMGNNSSVSIANITASEELRNMWKPEMIFKGRFIDDILCIVDVTEINTDINTWLKETFQHDFLKFTFESSFDHVNFLDLKISLNKNNEIMTSIYHKPVSKHEYLHFNSDHPRHIIKSLPYSCGLRVIRSCSDEIDRTLNVKLMLDKFRRRNYSDLLLSNVEEKLVGMDRQNLIIPRSNFHRQHIILHCPHLVSKLLTSHVSPSDSLTNNIFLIFPFYSQINNYKEKIKRQFITELCKCRSKTLKKLALDLNINVAFTIPSQVQRMLK